MNQQWHFIERKTIVESITDYTVGSDQGFQRGSPVRGLVVDIYRGTIGVRWECGIVSYSQPGTLRIIGSVKE